MGLFVMISGVAQTKKSQVEGALRQYAAQRSGTLIPIDKNENVNEDDLLLIAESNKGHTTIFYPASFNAWDDASQYLSKALGQPVLSLHIHDSDFWMYLLFFKGYEVGRFNPVPDYWGDLSVEESDCWTGDASVLSEYWPNIEQDKIANYLKPWLPDDDERYGVKAYPQDKCGIGEEFQLIDFMAKLGLVYPVDAKGNYRGSKYLFSVKSDF